MMNQQVSLRYLKFDTEMGQTECSLIWTGQQNLQKECLTAFTCGIPHYSWKEAKKPNSRTGSCHCDNSIFLTGFVCCCFSEHCAGCTTYGIQIWLPDWWTVSRSFSRAKEALNSFQHLNGLFSLCPRVFRSFSKVCTPVQRFISRMFLQSAYSFVSLFSGKVLQVAVQYTMTIIYSSLLLASEATEQCHRFLSCRSKEYTIRPWSWQR